jgi:hypothetical protein
MIQNKLFGQRMLIFLVLCLGIMKVTMGLHEFPVYKLIAYEENGQTSGSKIASFNLVGSHFSGDLLRKLAIIHFSEIQSEALSTILNKKIAGLLIILPKQADKNESEIWEVIYDRLVSKNTAIPVYFCWENEVITEFYEKSGSTIRGTKPTMYRNKN